MYNVDSLLEIAVKLLQSKKKPKKLKEIVKEVMTKKGYTSEEIKELAPQFMLDFMASGYFLYCGDDLWDLKDRRPLKELDKDAGFTESLSDNDEAAKEARDNELKDDEYDDNSSDDSSNDDDDDNNNDDDDDMSGEFDDDDDDEFDREFDSEEEEELGE